MILRSQSSGVKLILLGLGLMSSLVVWRFYQARVLSFTGNLETTDSNSETSLSQIEIPELAIKLGVEEGKIKNNVWQISETGASHLNSSANPKDSGNIVIYAHNRKDLFGALAKTRIGSDIILTTTDAQRYVYRVVETHEVNPTEIAFVQPKDEEILTLYTCSGLFDSNRFIVIAKPRS